MSNIIITYNGNTIAEVPEGKTSTLHCKGYVAATDIVIRFFVDGTVTYGGETFTVPAKYSLRLKCANRRMMSDVVMSVGGVTRPKGFILGSSKLGEAILGGAERLDAPIISLVDDSLTKLDTPIIRVETITDVEPEVPELTKLSTPIIRVETITDVEPEEPEEPEVPELTKLSTPIIRVENTVPELTKLETPLIELVRITE